VNCYALVASHTVVSWMVGASQAGITKTTDPRGRDDVPESNIRLDTAWQLDLKLARRVMRDLSGVMTWRDNVINGDEAGSMQNGCSSWRPRPSSHDLTATCIPALIIALADFDVVAASGIRAASGRKTR